MLLIQPTTFRLPHLPCEVLLGAWPPQHFCSPNSHYVPGLYFRLSPVACPLAVIAQSCVVFYMQPLFQWITGERDVFLASYPDFQT